MMPNTARARLRRLPKRAQYDEISIHRILDAGFLVHVGFLVDLQPFVIPTLYGRHENTIFLHGSAASRMLKNLAAGVAVCATVTLVDGLVLARSAFNHSMNYRSVVMFGTARPVEGASKLFGLRIISEHLLAGRWNNVRLPDREGTERYQPPSDDEVDYSLPHWAGIVPAQCGWKCPIADERLAWDAELPDYLQSVVQKRELAGPAGIVAAMFTL